MTEPRPRLRGVLLDIDGTLIDSNDAHAQAWSDVLRRNGYDRSFTDIRPLVGMGGDKLIPLVTGLDHEDPEAQRLSEERGKHFLETFVPRLQAFDGAHALVDALHARGLVVVVATSADEDELVPMVQQVGLERLLEQKTSASDAEHSKPDPDIISAALRTGGLSADETVMIGDTPYDVAAAGAAGVRCVAVRCGGWWTDDELRGATAILDGPRTVLDWIDAAISAE